MLTQLIPSKFCLSCDVCCRFLDKGAALRPLFLPHEITSKIKPFLDKSCRVKLKPWKDMHACLFFNTKNSRCAIYPKRPLDCRLYPFTIMFDEKREKIILGIDKKCPFSAAPENENAIKDYLHYLSRLLEKKEIASLIAKKPSFIGDFQEDVARFSYLGALTKLIINNPEKNRFRQISLKDKHAFDGFFKKIAFGDNSKRFSVVGKVLYPEGIDLPKPLKEEFYTFPHHKKIESADSSRNFVNLYIWKEKNPVWWKKNGGGLEILIETDSGYIDFNSLKRFPDYIYLAEDLIGLSGARYRHKRAGCNHFSKHYKFQYLAYRRNMKKDCLKLFSKWASGRRKKFYDLYYQQLLEDSFSAHKLAIGNFKALGLEGRVIKIKGKISAYTFGFEISKDMFCVLMEVCDLRFKGISEFIFREFCREMQQYKYINTMDDSGLENLRFAKLSYHPIITS